MQEMHSESPMSTITCRPGAHRNEYPAPESYLNPQRHWDGWIAWRTDDYEGRHRREDLDAVESVTPKTVTP
jgi:hypothetical protein